MLAFDAVASQQLDADGTIDLVQGATVEQSFTSRAARLHRVEISLRCRLPAAPFRVWFSLGEVDARGRLLRTLRRSPPVELGRLEPEGWFSFEFPRLDESRDRRYALTIDTDAPTPGIVAVGAHGTLGCGLARGGVARPGSLAYRAAAMELPELYASFSSCRAALMAGDASGAQPPLHLRLEVSTTCQLRCVTCAFGHAERPAAHDVRFLTLDVFRRVEHLVPGLLTVAAFGLGEPFLSPHFFPILRRVRALNPHLDVFVSTNGVSYPKDGIHALVAEQLVDVLQVSIDGAARSTCERLRPGLRYDVLTANLESLRREKGRHHRRSPHLKVAMVVMHENVGEISALVSQAADWGAEAVRFDIVKARESLLVASDRDLRRAAMELDRARRVAARRQIAIEGTAFEYVEQRRAGRKAATASPARAREAPACTAPWESVVLGADGGVRVCCDSGMTFGSVVESGFEDVWAGAPYRRIREHLRDGRCGEPCRTCIATSLVMPDQALHGVYGRRFVRGEVVMSAHGRGPVDLAATRGEAGPRLPGRLVADRRRVCVELDTERSVRLLPWYRSGIVGHVNHCAHEGDRLRLSGWVVDCWRPDRPVTVGLFADGVPLAAVVPSIERPDVARALGRVFSTLRRAMPFSDRWRSADWQRSGFVLEVSRSAVPALREGYASSPWRGLTRGRPADLVAAFAAQRRREGHPTRGARLVAVAGTRAATELTGLLELS